MLYRVGVLLAFLSNILCISILMYVIFYYTYMPDVTHVRPVHLEFQSCDENMGVCSYPSAHVELTRRSQMLMSSQPYRVKLVMEVPETQINKDLGMFMVCAQMRTEGGAVVSSSCRSAMLRYRSEIHHVMRTLVYAPLLIYSIHDENQMIQVELFSDFQDNQTHPVTDAYIELRSRFVQVLSCELHLEAHFTGLQYVIYNWPKASAFIGICTNLFVVSLMIVLNWHHLQVPEYINAFIKTKPRIAINNEIMEEARKSSAKAILSKEDFLPFVEKHFQNIEKTKGFFLKLVFILLMLIFSWFRFILGLPMYINLFIKRKLEIEIKNEKAGDDRILNKKKKLDRKGFTFLEKELLAEEFKKLENKKIKER